jgi:hypothetical protein
MKSATMTKLLAAASAVFLLSAPAYAADSDNGVELAFMPNTVDVTLLNEGGKFVTVDMKKIAKGEKCRMDKDAVIMKVGPGEAAGTVRVRFAAPQLSHGGCPFMTEFELSDADYKTARNAFTQKTDEASKKVDALKKQLGDKWNELVGSKK